jgi:hypothetical protein
MAIADFLESMFLYELSVFPGRIPDVGGMVFLLHSYKLTLVRIWGIFSLPDIFLVF